MRTSSSRSSRTCLDDGGPVRRRRRNQQRAGRRLDGDSGGLLVTETGGGTPCRRAAGDHRHLHAPADEGADRPGHGHLPLGRQDARLRRPRRRRPLDHHRPRRQAADDLHRRELEPPVHGHRSRRTRRRPGRRRPACAGLPGAAARRPRTSSARSSSRATDRAARARQGIQLPSETDVPLPILTIHVDETVTSRHPEHLQRRLGERGHRPHGPRHEPTPSLRRSPRSTASPPARSTARATGRSRGSTWAPASRSTSATGRSGRRYLRRRHRLPRHGVVHTMLGRATTRSPSTATSRARSRSSQGGGGNDTPDRQRRRRPRLTARSCSATRARTALLQLDDRAHHRPRARELLRASGNDTIDARNDTSSVAIYGGGGNDIDLGQPGRRPDRRRLRQRHDPRPGRRRPDLRRRRLQRRPLQAVSASRRRSCCS